MEVSNVNNIKKERSIWIDALRGLAMIFILWGHSNDVLCRMNWQCVLWYPSVPAFFLITGYLYTKGKYSAKEYIGTRAKRLLIPYVVYGVLIILFESISFGSRNIDFGFIKHNLIGILYGRACITYPDYKYYVMNSTASNLWFFPCLFIACVLFVIAMNLEGIKQIIVICLYGLLALATNLLPILLPWSIDTAFYGVIFMLVGQALKNVNFKEFSKGKTAGVIMGAFVIWFAIGYVIRQGSVNMAFRLMGDSALTSVFVVLMIVAGFIVFAYAAILSEKCFVGKLLARVGKNTVVLMAINKLFYNTFQVVFTVAQNYIHRYVVIVLEILLVILVGEIIKWIFEKMKLRYLV